jgi:pyruvate dehydrogenase E2 component (dihydrolipoamide acetyltransferase)
MEMVEQVIMPKLGMMEADIRLSEWLVKEGELVAEDQELCEVESQKIALLGEPGDDISEFL